jgi:hypothetical protein
MRDRAAALGLEAGLTIEHIAKNHIRKARKSLSAANRLQRTEWHGQTTYLQLHNSILTLH